MRCGMGRREVVHFWWVWPPRYVADTQYDGGHQHSHREGYDKGDG